MFKPDRSDFSELADLIDAFSDANEAFKIEHKKDYKSPECHAAYEKKDAAACALEDAWEDAIEAFPRELAAALRASRNRHAAAAS